MSEVNKYPNFYACLEDMMNSAPTFIEPKVIKNSIDYGHGNIDVEVEHTLNGERIISEFTYSKRGVSSEENLIKLINIKHLYKSRTGHTLDLKRVLSNIYTERNDLVYDFCLDYNIYPANYTFCNWDYTFNKVGHIPNVVYYDTNSNHFSDYRRGLYKPVLSTLKIDNYDNEDTFLELKDLVIERKPNKAYIIHTDIYDIKRNKLSGADRALLLTGQSSLFGKRIPYRYQNLIILGDEIHSAYDLCVAYGSLRVLRVMSFDVERVYVEDEYIKMIESLYHEDKALLGDIGLKEQSQILVGFLAMRDKESYVSKSYHLHFDDEGVSLVLEEGRTQPEQRVEQDGRLTAILFMAMQNEKSYNRVKRAERQHCVPLYSNLDSVVAINPIPEEEGNVGLEIGNVKRKTGEMSLYHFGRYAIYNGEEIVAMAFGGDARPIKTYPTTLDDFDNKQYEIYDDFTQRKIAYTEHHDYGLILNYPSNKASESHIHLITGVAGSGKTTHVRSSFGDKNVLTLMFNRAPCDKLNKGIFTLKDALFDNPIHSPALTYSQLYKFSLNRRALSLMPTDTNYIDFVGLMGRIQDDNSLGVLPSYRNKTSLLFEKLLSYDILHIDEYQAVNEVDWVVADWLINEYVKMGKDVYISGDDYQHLRKVASDHTYMTWEQIVSRYDCSVETYLTQYRSDVAIHNYLYSNNPTIKCGKTTQGSVIEAHSVAELEALVGTTRDVVLMARGRQQVARLRDKIATSVSLFDIPIMSALQSVSTEHEVVVLYDFDSKMLGEDDVMVDREMYLALSRCKNKLIFLTK